MTQKEKSDQNLQKPKAPMEIITKKKKINEKESKPTNNFIKDCQQVLMLSLNKTSSLINDTSDTLEEIENDATNMDSTLCNQAELIKDGKKEVVTLNQNISDVHKGLHNVHEKLLQNNNSRSKCVGAVTATGGTTSIIVGGVVISSTSIVPAIAIGCITIALGISMLIYGVNNLRKKPSPTVRGIDVEQGVPEASKCLPI